jgi:hypothetical protein
LLQQENTYEAKIGKKKTKKVMTKHRKESVKVPAAERKARKAKLR